MDLTPYYPFTEDIRHFHATCKQALLPFGEGTHAATRNGATSTFSSSTATSHAESVASSSTILSEGGFERCFALTRAVGDAFTEAYLPIIDKAQGPALWRTRT
jgi:coproporphyrinogen III oxidase